MLSSLLYCRNQTGCDNNQVRKPASSMAGDLPWFATVTPASSCQRLPAPVSWCSHAARITCAELEFRLGMFLHGANPQGLKVAQPLPQLSTIATTHPTDNSQSEAPRNRPQTTCKPQAPPHSITAELEFGRGSHAAPGGPVGIMLHSHYPSSAFKLPPAIKGQSRGRSGQSTTVGQKNQDGSSLSLTQFVPLP